MKKFRKSSIVVAAALALLALGPWRSAFAEPDGAYFSSSSVVTVSTSMITGATKLLSRSNIFGDVYLVAAPTLGVCGEQIAIGTTSSVSTNTTSGNFRFPVSVAASGIAGGPFNTCIPMVDAFVIKNYKGDLYAIVVGTTPLNVSVLRKQ